MTKATVIEGETPPDTHYLSIICMIILSAVFTIYAGDWPEIYIFYTNSSNTEISRLLEAPVHLSDDVMISLRTGQLLNEIGFPAFNRSDFAQPSTNYLAPYVFSLLLKLVSENIAVLLYALLGFVSVFCTFFLIAYKAKSKINAVLIIGLLSITTTNINYALNGWDHLYQVLFLTLALVIMLKRMEEGYALISIPTCLAVAVLFRPDGLLIAATILLATVVGSEDKRRVFLFVVPPFILIIGCALAFNFTQFGWITPTTVRLKVGASPSLEYSLLYFFKNTLCFSAITIFLASIVVYMTFRKKIFNNIDSMIVIGCFTTGAVAFYNADAFSGGRMFWAPAIIMATLLAAKLPTLLKIDPLAFSQLVKFNNFYRYLKNSKIYELLFSKLTFSIFIATIIIPMTFDLAWKKISISVVSFGNIYRSPTSQQFVIAKWIERNLQPYDGAIGLFHLGVGYHIPSFEIADFLGKADEIIATSKVRWGPPGHNKWDIDKTLDKWNLQAIVPPGNLSRNRVGVLNDAKLSILQKQNFGFSADLVLNERINERFSYCYILEQNREKPLDRWGFFIKKEIAIGHRNSLLCD